MITDSIISIAFTVLSWIISIFPTSTGFSTDVTTAFTTIGGYVGMWTGLLPMSILATAIGIVFSVEIIIFLFKTVKWIASHIPWIGGKGN